MVDMTKKILTFALLVVLTVPFVSDARIRLSSNDRDWLGDDIVDDVYIPILFGVEVDDLERNFADARDGGSRSHEGQERWEVCVHSKSRRRNISVHAP